MPTSSEEARRRMPDHAEGFCRGGPVPRGAWPALQARAKPEGPRSTSTFFRPEKTDVVIYDAIHNELRINASTFADVREYRVQFGRHVFGGEDKFVFAEKYTLDPLKEDGRAALNCRDIAGLDTVKLREIEYSWGSAFEHFEVHRAESLFHALALIQRTIEAEAQIRKAVFKIKLDDEKKLEP